MQSLDKLADLWGGLLRWAPMATPLASSKASSPPLLNCICMPIVCSFLLLTFSFEICDAWLRHDLWKHPLHNTLYEHIMCEYTLTSGNASCMGPGPSSQTVTVQGILTCRQSHVLIVTLLIQRKPRIELQLQHLPRQNHSAQFGHTSANVLMFSHKQLVLQTRHSYRHTDLLLAHEAWQDKGLCRRMRIAGGCSNVVVDSIEVGGSWCQQILHNTHLHVSYR